MNAFHKLLAKHNQVCIVIIILVCGILPRIWLLALPNNDDDLFFQEWVGRILNHGLGNVYDPEFGRIKAMHPPLNYYLLWASGVIYRAFYMSWPAEIDPTSVSLMVLIKAPNLLCDLLIAIIIFLAIRKRFDFPAAVMALCLYWFNPAIIWEAGFVGQIEAVQTLPVVLAVILLLFNKVELSWAAMTLAVLTKPQGVVLIPLVGLISILTYQVKRLLAAALLALVVMFGVLLPWILNGRIMDVAQIYINTVDTYPYLTLNAANIWALVASVMYDKFSIGGGEGEDTMLLPDSDFVQWVPFFTYKQLGLILFALSYAFTLFCIYRRRDWVTFCMAAAFVLFAFFMLPTQITERYLFPFFPLFVMAVTQGIAALAIYLGASMTFMLNLYMVFPMANVSPWHVVSNAKDPLPHQYLSIMEYRHSLTVGLCIINLTLITWLAAILYRRCSGDMEGDTKDFPFAASAPRLNDFTQMERTVADS